MLRLFRTLQVEWYLLTCANQKTWNVAMMRLHPDPDAIAQREAQLFSHIALRVALGGMSKTGCPFKDLEVEPLPRHWFGADLTRKCSYAIHHFSESERKLDFFVPAQIEVDQSTVCKAFWPGSKAAREAYARAKARIRKPAAGAAKAPLGDDEVDIPVDGDFDAPPAGYEDGPVGEPPEGGCGDDDPAEGWGALLFEEMEIGDPFEESLNYMFVSLGLSFYVALFIFLDLVFNFAFSLCSIVCISLSLSLSLSLSICLYIYIYIYKTVLLSL